eukprot:scaffold155_cov347-Pavlova_lutheri.AAC.89
MERTSWSDLGSFITPDTTIHVFASPFMKWCEISGSRGSVSSFVCAASYQRPCVFFCSVDEVRLGGAVKGVWRAGRFFFHRCIVVGSILGGSACTICIVRCVFWFHWHFFLRPFVFLLDPCGCFQQLVPGDGIVPEVVLEDDFGDVVGSFPPSSCTFHRFQFRLDHLSFVPLEFVDHESHQRVFRFLSFRTGSTCVSIRSFHSVWFRAPCPRFVHVGEHAFLVSVGTHASLLVHAQHGHARLRLLAGSVGVFRVRAASFVLPTQHERRAHAWFVPRLLVHEQQSVLGAFHRDLDPFHVGVAPSHRHHLQFLSFRVSPCLDARRRGSFHAQLVHPALQPKVSERSGAVQQEASMPTQHVVQPRTGRGGSTRVFRCSFGSHQHRFEHGSIGKACAKGAQVLATCVVEVDVVVSTGHQDAPGTQWTRCNPPTSGHGVWRAHHPLVEAQLARPTRTFASMATVRGSTWTGGRDDVHVRRRVGDGLGPCFSPCLPSVKHLHLPGAPSTSGLDRVQRRTNVARGRHRSSNHHPHPHPHAILVLPGSFPLSLPFTSFLPSSCTLV